ncbi:MAG: BlaI/MecI/CopY family transcriptional regulator [Oscillospiraceae bacterium]|jgi:predicted transcriptional regulator|nr:BlaI/MecI/CopY family transcriptional regulator [Oscillospiraceae bacterium]
MAGGLKLFDAEYRFACIVWENEPVPSGRLAELCLEKLGWKRTTVYTVLRKLVGRGILKHEHTMVTAIAKKEDVQGYESAAVVDRAFGGSLPSFVSAFLKTKKLTPEEAAEMQRLIDAYTETPDGTAPRGGVEG